MQPRPLIITKSGGVLWTRCNKASASATGEAGETEGVIRHLAKRPDLRIIYFGRFEGQLPDNVTTIQAQGQNYGEFIMASEQEAGWQKDEIAVADTLGGEQPIGLLNILGYSPTWSYIANPRGARPYLVGIKFTGPMLNILQKFKIPRFCVNNDPRNYPKDQEMSYGWNYCRPLSLLDQWNHEVKQVVGGERYLRKSVYAAAESWGYHEIFDCDRYRTIPCTILAHAHIRDGIGATIKNERNRAWGDVIGDTSLLPKGTMIYGSGWEAYDYYNPMIMLGKISQAEAIDVLRISWFCPCVGLLPGFYTAKMYQAINQGCIPLFYGRGKGNDQPYTYDSDSKFLPMNSKYRIGKPRELRDLVEDLMHNKDERFALRREFQNALIPNFTKLDQMIDDLLAGADPYSPEWPKFYGGYLPL